MSEATERPWDVVTLAGIPFGIGSPQETKRGNIIHEMVCNMIYHGRDKTVANAALIVRCVNALPDLLAAAEAALHLAQIVKDALSGAGRLTAQSVDIGTHKKFATLARDAENQLTAAIEKAKA